jgi:hypothetical protein
MKQKGLGLECAFPDPGDEQPLTLTEYVLGTAPQLLACQRAVGPCQDDVRKSLYRRRGLHTFEYGVSLRTLRMNRTKPTSPATHESSDPISDGAVLLSKAVFLFPVARRTLWTKDKRSSRSKVPAQSIRCGLIAERR